jgi:hypothetical protein
MKNYAKNIVNQKFGRLTAKKLVKRKGYKHYWLFKCDCGKEIIRLKWNVTAPKGGTKSCGCFKKDKNKKLFTKEKNPLYSHGMSGTRFYRIWKAIKARCNNKNVANYKNYGGRGIKCEWKNFDEFKDDMFNSYKNDLTIDRINNNGNYCKNNCRWITYREQANNTRKNTVIEYNGEINTLAEWCRILNIPYNKITQRINKLKWDIEKAFTYKI